MTTQVIHVRNVNEALIEGLWRLKTGGVLEGSRNGPVLVAPGPVVTEYSHPRERVLWNPLRDANPVFHLIESLWMLAGRSDVDSLLPFNKQMAQYAEEGGYLHGAYGHRWRNHFRRDQLDSVIGLLRADPNTRRAVLAMWDADSDLDNTVKDLPCNTHIYFDLRGGALNMTVCCRSNDVVWGAYGANAVHFSILQEFLACALGVEMGVYRQMSNNFHAYTESAQVQALLDAPWTAPDPYINTSAPPPMVKLVQPYEPWTDFLMDCQDLFEQMSNPEFEYRTYFMNRVAAPLADAYLGRKAGRPIDWGSILDCDWKLAFQQWVARRVQPTIAGDAA